MTLRTTIVIFSIIASFYSCSNTKRNDKTLETQANYIIQRLDTSTLNFLEQWDYVQRGQFGFWSRLSNDSSIFNCAFFQSIDSPKLSTFQVKKFLTYFKSNLKVDTPYFKIQFTKIGDTALNLLGTNRYGQDILLSQNLSFSKTFPDQDPFEIFSRLTNLKDTIDVIGIKHYNVIGGFVEFYLPGGQHILTHIPDTLLNSSLFSRYWKTVFSKGKQIKPNWNFRKLDYPIDGG